MPSPKKKFSPVVGIGLLILAALLLVSRIMWPFWFGRYVLRGEPIWGYAPSTLFDALVIVALSVAAAIAWVMYMNRRGRD